MLDVPPGAGLVQRRPLRLRATPTALSTFSSSPAKRRGTTFPMSLRTASRSSPTTRCTIRCFPTACAICEVEIDPDTGAVAITRYASVDDVGRCINPLIVHGQTHGAIAQGVGQAMWEQIYLDPDSGQPLTGSLMDYGMPRADTLPSFKTEIAEVLSPTNPLGIKAGGEGGTTRGARGRRQRHPRRAARRSACATSPMPATPYAIWSAIQGRQSAQRGPMMPMHAPILSLDKVSKRFGAIVVADAIDLALAEGEALGIIGPNGAGKTTLFGIVSGTVAPDSGRVLYAGRGYHPSDAGAALHHGDRAIFPDSAAVRRHERLSRISSSPQRSAVASASVTPMCDAWRFSISADLPTKPTAPREASR